MVSFLLQKILHGNLNVAITLTEIDVTFKVSSTSANEIPSFRFPQKISCMWKMSLATCDRGEYGNRTI